MLHFLECWWQLSIKLFHPKHHLLSHPHPQLMGSDMPARQCPTMQFNKLEKLLPHPPKKGRGWVSVLQLSLRSINLFPSLSGMNKQVWEIKTFHFEPSFLSEGSAERVWKEKGIKGDGNVYIHKSIKKKKRTAWRWWWLGRGGGYCHFSKDMRTALLLMSVISATLLRLSSVGF